MTVRRVNVSVIVRNTTLQVEALEQSIHVDVIRSLGTVGVVSVDVVTQSGSAIGQVGPHLHLSRLQSVCPAKYFPIDSNTVLLNFIRF